MKIFSRVKKLFFWIAPAMLLYSCQDPMPVYFDKPVGAFCDSFPAFMRGNYFLVDNDAILRSALDNGKFEVINDTIFFSEKLKRKNDSIYRIKRVKDSIENLNVKDTASKNYNFLSDTTSMSPKDLDMKMNQLAFERRENDSDLFRRKTIFSYFQFTGNAWLIHSIDSSGMNYVDTFLRLGKNVKLGVYKEKYFLNFKTPDGYELIVFEQCREKLLCMQPIYLLKYPGNGKDEKEMLEFLGHYYPDPKAVHNKEGIFAGIRVKTDPKKILKLLRSIDTELFLVKQK